jgi:DNA-binding XRE family transcriptional regulator
MLLVTRVTKNEPPRTASHRLRVARAAETPDITQDGRVTEQQELRPAWAEFVKEFGRNLCAIRTSRGLSQESVARKANITTAAYGRLERGEGPDGAPADPPLRTLLEVMAALGITWGDVLPKHVPKIIAD